MPGDVGQIEGDASLVYTEVVDEIAGQIQRRNDLVSEHQPVGLPRGHREHVHLHLATGVLVFLEQAQAGLQLAVGGFQLFPVATVLGAQIGAIQRAAHRVLEHGEVFQRLDQVVGGAQAQSLHHIAHHSGAREHDHRRFHGLLADPADQFEAVHLRHAQIADHHIGQVVFENLQTLQAIGCLQYMETTVFQIGGETNPHYFVVIDDQQLGTGFVHGVSRHSAPKLLDMAPLW
ncbi:hypothetical protein D3C81_1291320 [compost metagenome]